MSTFNFLEIHKPLCSFSRMISLAPPSVCGKGDIGHSRLHSNPMSFVVYKTAGQSPKWKSEIDAVVTPSR